MGKQEALIDADAFLREASRFALTRETFDPSSVEILAGDIVRRLSRVATHRNPLEEPRISERSIEDFCAVLTRTDPAAAIAFIEQERANGLTRHDVYLGYVTGAARELGESWNEDRLSFMEVTVACGNLYALMRALRSEGPPGSHGYDARRHALFATIPGETHGIGVTVAADLFRESGWEIDLQVGSGQDELVSRVESTRPQIIGLSVSTDRRLEDLVRLVVALRLVTPQALIGVAPGADLDESAINGLVDVDLVFYDAAAALRDLERLVWLRR